MSECFGCSVVGCGGETKIKVWLCLNLDLEKALGIFSQSASQGQSGYYKAMRHPQKAPAGVLIYFTTILIHKRHLQISGEILKEQFFVFGNIHG